MIIQLPNTHWSNLLFNVVEYSSANILINQSIFNQLIYVKFKMISTPGSSLVQLGDDNFDSWYYQIRNVLTNNDLSDLLEDNTQSNEQVNEKEM